jgi:hypothetical protein
MNKRITSLTTALLSLVLAACASAPTWQGMSESEISGWKALSVDVASAQEFRKAGLSAAAVEQWREAGLTTTDAILAWNESGYTPETAGPWVRQGFDLATSADWTEQKFTAEEARVWVDSGFSLKQAIDNREKGLTPVR